MKQKIIRCLGVIVVGSIVFFILDRLPFRISPDFAVGTLVVWIAAVVVAWKWEDIAWEWDYRVARPHKKRQSKQHAKRKEAENEAKADAFLKRALDYLSRENVEDALMQVLFACSFNECHRGQTVHELIWLKNQAKYPQGHKTVVESHLHALVMRITEQIRHEIKQHSDKVASLRERVDRDFIAKYGDRDYSHLSPADRSTMEYSDNAIRASMWHEAQSREFTQHEWTKQETRIKEIAQLEQIIRDKAWL